MAVTVSTVLSILNNNSKDYSKIKIEDNKISFTDSNNAENILKFNDSGEVFYNNERIFDACSTCNDCNRCFGCTNCDDCQTCHDRCVKMCVSCNNCTGCDSCASNCTNCVGSCTSGCNSGCTGSCASCTGCLTCNGYCNACTICNKCTSSLTCEGSFNCPENFNMPCPAFISPSYCPNCVNRCNLCNDTFGICIYNVTPICQAGNGLVCKPDF